jgi:hypothetical protein
MPFIEAPGVAQCNIRAEYLGVPMENVLNFLTPEDPITPSLLVDIGASLAVSWSSNVLPFVVANYVVKEILVIDLSSQFGGTATDTSLAGSAGDVADNALPGNVVFCVSLRTAERGRSRRGRIFLSGLGEGQVTGNLVSPTVVTNLVNAIEGVRTDMLTAGYQMVIVSRQENNVPRTTALSTPVTTVLAVDSEVDTLRGRLR